MKDNNTIAVVGMSHLGLVAGLSLSSLKQKIIGFDINNYFLFGMESKSKEERHATVQAIRNFSDASSVTLNIIKQPGIDSVVSFLIIQT